MNYNTRLKVGELKNNLLKPMSNIPTDTFLETLEEMNKTIWEEEDFKATEQLNKKILKELSK